MSEFAKTIVGILFHRNRYFISGITAARFISIPKFCKNLVNTNINGDRRRLGLKTEGPRQVIYQETRLYVPIVSPV